MADPTKDHQIIDGSSKPEKAKGRSFCGWIKLLVFYLVFYFCLCLFFCVMLWLSFRTLDYRMPRWQLQEGIIGTNPGLAVRPQSPMAAGSSLIWFRHGHAGNWYRWINELHYFLDGYKESYNGYDFNKRECDFSSISDPHTEGTVCSVDLREIHSQCSKSDVYGYEHGRPCVFLKLNKIYGWKPEYYNNPDDLPENMPQQLIDYIRNRQRQVDRPEKMNVVWVSCEGEKPVDVEHIGPIFYASEIQGFPGYYFPYTNNVGYLSPIVAVQFSKPRLGVLINVVCKAWAKNILPDTEQGKGSVRFQLMVD